MEVTVRIDEFLKGLPEARRAEMQQLHTRIKGLQPGCRVWFEDGKDSAGKTIANPTIGYGGYTIRYANGTERPFFRIGLSANSTGISVYIMGVKDKTWLSGNYGDRLGKAKVTGYCIRFRSWKDIHPEVFDEAISAGFALPDDPDPQD